MAVSGDELAAIGALLAQSTEPNPVAQLRREFPGLSWTACDASDVTDEPFQSFPLFDLHLLNSKDHCSQITSDPAQATGLILARRS
ncbi:hypothetical protein [Methylocapsa palsarum]|uniref:Uncharacterized protein n=1 Tax=Methylocapsa palsarum TaxID=1612308 RepID=A0A1I3W7W6_9HYPH|nr:hypothetical protein [Methylocapsa palsarum]SFK02541.1 hypothetical protein SAMN05444581_101350 [Methylocapsa palsarum]